MSRGQVVTAGAQLFYAAVTSRLVTDTGFGEYAVALSVFGLIALLANGGLGQAAARLREINGGVLSALSFYAYGLGILAAGSLLLTADFWAAVWGAPHSAGAIRLLSISAFFAPLVGLSTGTLRRQGRYGLLAGIVVTSNVVGMGVGIAIVVHSPGPIALAASPVLAMVLLALFAVSLNLALYSRRPNLNLARVEVMFSWRVTAMNLLAYAGGNVGKIALSQGVGVSVLGQWNRADVVTTLPMEQAQTAVQQAVYPEFRHDARSGSRTSERWTDLLSLVAWVALPGSALLAVTAPAVIPVLFGPGWEAAVSLSVALAVAGGIRMLFVTLGGAMEAIARFREVALVLGVGLLTQSVGAVIAVLNASVTPILAGLLISLVMQHALQVALCARSGLINYRDLARQYFFALLFSMAVVLGVASVGFAFGKSPLVGFLVLATEALIVVASTWRYWRVFPPVAIFRRRW